MNEQTWLTSSDPGAMLRHLGDKTSPRKLRLFAVACCRAIWSRLTDDVPCTNPACWYLYGKYVVSADNRPHSAVGPVKPCPDCHGTGRINRSRRAVEVAEQYADGEVTLAELRQLEESAHDAFGSSGTDATNWAWLVAGPINTSHFEHNPLPGELHIQATLLRDIFGNPFRPVGTIQVWESKRPKDVPGRENFMFGELQTALVPWLTPEVQAIAQTIYTERRFDEMPVLADALEEAGCTNETILSHLRGLDLTLDPEMPNKYRWAKLRGSHVRGCWALDILLNKC